MSEVSIAYIAAMISANTRAIPSAENRSDPLKATKLLRAKIRVPNIQEADELKMKESIHLPCLTRPVLCLANSVVPAPSVCSLSNFQGACCADLYKCVNKSLITVEDRPQAMQPPCEIMVSQFLPNMRGIVAHELAERGNSQRKIATLLGITQARVSHYLSSRKSIYYAELRRSFGITENELEGYARILGEDVSRSQADGIFTLYSIWKNMLFSGGVCEAHQRSYSISSGCSVCMDIHRPQNEPIRSKQRDDDYYVLQDLSEAVALVENSIAFTKIIPEVSVNIAMCRQNPKSRSDVAAIPGRINKIHGRAKAFVLPEFGSSNHLSNVLLLLNSRLPQVRSVMNVRYDRSVGDCLSSLGISKFFTGAPPNQENGQPVRNKATAATSSSDEIILKRLANIEFEEDGETKGVFAIVDRGSEGLEPMTYLFGPKATETSNTALKVARLYSGQ